MKADLTQPVQTVSGRRVVLYTTTRNDSQYPVVGDMIDGDGSHELGQWTADGKCNFWTGNPDPNDLVNVPKAYAVWVNMYKSHGGNCVTASAHSAREVADVIAKPRRIACVEVQFCEGDGLYV